MKTHGNSQESPPATNPANSPTRHLREAEANSLNRKLIRSGNKCAPTPRPKLPRWRQTDREPDDSPPAANPANSPTCHFREAEANLPNRKPIRTRNKSAPTTRPKLLHRRQYGRVFKFEAQCRATYTLFTVRNEHPLVARLRAVYGGSISRINLYDANASRQHANSARYTYRFLMRVDGRRIQVYFGEELACIRLTGNFALTILTVNSADYFGQTKNAGTVHIGPAKLVVFCTGGNLTGIHKRILDSKEMRTLAAFHSFRKGEAIHFYRDALRLYLRNEDVNAAIIRMLNAVAKAVPSA